jgi:hypothetical protein
LSIYEIGILGDACAADRESLTSEIRSAVETFGLSVGTDVAFYSAKTIRNRDAHAAFAAVYFGGTNHEDARIAGELISQSLPVIPVIKSDSNFAVDIPAILQSTNGYRLRREDAAMTDLAMAVLECVGLLRRQRRVFISYRRVESSPAALQLHDLLSARGFDVFLDTHDIRPGDPFQDVLWNRLCDSDVMVMLDTPTYFESKWTRQEVVTCSPICPRL